MQRAGRLYSMIGTAVLGAAILAGPAATPPTPGTGVRLLNGENVAFIIGGSGNPIPDDSYVETSHSLFVDPNFPDFTPEAFFTPAGNYALYTGVKSLTLDQSEAQGAQILNDAITERVADEDHVAVFGDSQNSTISSMVMSELADQGVSADNVGFVLAADPNVPDGGLFERLEGLSIPSLGITFNGPTPPDVPYETYIYTQEYDGFADVPRYPINFISDLNSIAGIQYVHPTYQDLTPEQIDAAITLDTSDDYDGATTYYMLPTEDLPLLEPLRAVPGLGDPLADLLQPALRQIVNLGYDNPDNEGWDAGPANEPVPFGLFPSMDQVTTALDNLGPALQQGVDDAWADITGGDLFSAASSAETSAGDAAPPSLTDIVDTFTDVVSTAYAALLPTADVITGVTVTIPAYSDSLLADGLEDGDLVSALLQPLANDTYLYTLAAGFELFALINTVTTISDDLSEIMPF